MVTEIKRGNKGEMARKKAHKLHKLPFSASSCAPTAFFLIKSPFDDSLPFSLSLTYRGGGRENPHKMHGYG